jgi:Alkylmercury lyase
VTERELELRRKIMLAFAETGEPPTVADRATLAALAEQHVVVLDDDRIVMAHPFAGSDGDAVVESDGAMWWGNCAWDGLGIVAALGCDTATVTSTDVTVDVTDGEVEPGPVFHVEVPTRRWWDDIAHT